MPIHGLISCPNDGHLEIMLNGYDADGFKQKYKRTAEGDTDDSLS